MPAVRDALAQRPMPRRAAAIAIALVAITFAVYGRVAGHDFVELDDGNVIVNNPLVREGLTLSSVLRAFREPAEANWVPLTWISLQLGITLHGLSPAGFLLTNVALHALASLLLFFALLRLTAATWESAFVAAVFALHPLHVESVAWAASRKDVLSGVFFMLTLLAWARYAERPSAARHAVATLALAAGLLSKPTLVTTPFVLWLLDGWPLRRFETAGGFAASARRAGLLLLEKLPMLALAAAASAIAYAVQSGVGATAQGARIPVALRIMNALDAYRIYLAQSLWPSGLAVFYPHPLVGLGSSRVIAASLLLAALSAVALAGVRKRPYLLVGWLWFFGMLVPVSGLVQVGMQAHADRYMYLPLIGLALAAAFLAGDALRARPALRVPIAAAASLALAALALVAANQTASFRDAIALHSRNAAVTEDSFLAHQRLANALQRAGRLAEAQAAFERALALAPNRADLHLGLADVLARSGRGEAAIAQYRLSIAAEPRAARAHANLALALANAGQLAPARFHFERALALMPPGPQGADGRSRVLSALSALAAKREDAGRGEDAARLRALASELDGKASQPE